MSNLPLTQPKTFTQKELETTTMSTTAVANPGHALVPTGYTPPRAYDYYSDLYSLPAEERARAIQASILAAPSKQRNMSPKAHVVVPKTGVGLEVPGVITWREHLSRAVHGGSSYA